jgi:hypothetical protein
MKKIEERRADKRFEQKEEISLKIVFSSENPGLLGKNLSGETLDVSASGLRISLPFAIKLDSVLDVWVRKHKANKKYFLTGNVRWCHEDSDGSGYLIGLVLRERTDTITDLASWKDSFK